MEPVWYYAGGVKLGPYQLLARYPSSRDITKTKIRMSKMMPIILFIPVGNFWAIPKMKININPIPDSRRLTKAPSAPYCSRF